MNRNKNNKENQSFNESLRRAERVGLGVLAATALFAVLEGTGVVDAAQDKIGEIIDDAIELPFEDVVEGEETLDEHMVGDK